MRRALIYSLILHVAVIAIGSAGGFFWPTEPLPMEIAIVVEVVPVSDKTNVPVRKKREAVAKSKSKKRSTSTSGDSRALKRAAPKPKVARPPARAAAPPAEPAPKTSVRKPAPNPLPASPGPKPNLKVAKPKQKPESEKIPASSFASVLKTVEALSQQSPSKDNEPEKPSKPAASDALSRSRSANYQASEPVTMSEIDQVRRQIERCWNLPAGARGAENMVVSIRVEMNIDGTPSVADVVEQERMRSDSYFRAAAESALRAVLNPRCHPFGLPREKYDSWKTMTLVFDPKEMFGT